MKWAFIGANGRRRMEEHGEVGKKNEMEILVRVRNKDFVEGRYINYEIFRVDLKRDGDTAVSQCCPPLRSNAGEGCMVCLGSMIFILNDELLENDDPSSESDWDADSDSDSDSDSTAPTPKQQSESIGYRKVAYQIDLNQQERLEWMQVSSPKHTRGFPNAVALHGKIYYFGSSRIPEVYDPKASSNGWVELPPPPGKLGDSIISHPLIPDPSNNRILAHLYALKPPSGSIYAYYPDGDGDGDGDGAGSVTSWKCVAPDARGWNKVSALVDDVIYCYLGYPRNFFGAFDLVTNGWLKVVWSSPYPNDVCSTEYDDLIYLGNGLLCLAVYTPVITPDGSDGHIFNGCRTFFILVDFKRSVDADTSVITFNYRCTRSYDFPSADEVVHYFPLDPSVAAITEPEDSSAKPKHEEPEDSSMKPNNADVTQKKDLPLQYWALPVAIVGISVIVSILYLRRCR